MSLEQRLKKLEALLIPGDLENWEIADHLATIADLIDGRGKVPVHKVIDEVYVALIRIAADRLTHRLHIPSRDARWDQQAESP
jgi:hypothetical protein